MTHEPPKMKSIQETKKPLTPQQLERAARVFSTLSEVSRLRLLQELMQGPGTVSELVEATGMKQGNVSKQLGILHNARLVERERDGNFIRYAIADEMVVHLCEVVCDSLRRQAIREAEQFTL